MKKMQKNLKKRKNFLYFEGEQRIYIKQIKERINKMGLGFSICFPVGEKQKTTKNFYEKYFKELPSIVPNWNTSCFFYNSEFRIKLVPFEEEICGVWEDDRVRMFSKTNSAGPGYHAYLIDVMDGLGVTPISVEDETGYYKNRDFTALQNEMAKWLKGISEAILKLRANKNCTDFAISLPNDWRPENTGHFACCPLGYFEKNFFKRAQNREDAASKFFIWWNQQQDAMFLNNCAKYLIWCENNWLQPQTDTEHEIISATLECLEKAYTLDPDLEYPAAEWIELARLLEDKSLEKKLLARFGITGSGKLGYKQGSVNSSFNGWRFTHSGKMHFRHKQGERPLWWSDDRAISIETSLARLKEDTTNKNETLLRSIIKNETDCESFSLHNSKIAAYIQHSQLEDNGEYLYHTRLIAALENEFMIMSLLYAHEDSRKWAMDVCASVMR